MPRGGKRSGGSSFRGSSSSTPKRQTVAATRPMPAQTKPQTEQSRGIFSGMGSAIMHGFGFGAGSEVAHQAVRSVTGANSQHHQAEQQQIPQRQTQQNPCQTEMDSFSNCLSTNDNIAYCQNFSDMLKNCKTVNQLIWFE